MPRLPCGKCCWGWHPWLHFGCFVQKREMVFADRRIPALLSNQPEPGAHALEDQTHQYFQGHKGDSYAQAKRLQIAMGYSSQAESVELCCLHLSR